MGQKEPPPKPPSPVPVPVPVPKLGMYTSRPFQVQTASFMYGYSCYTCNRHMQKSRHSMTLVQ